MKTPVTSMLLMFVASFLGSFGAVFLKSGATRLRFEWRSLMRNWHLAVGVCFFGLSSFFFVLGIRQGELSVLYPMISLGYIWTLLWSRLFFHEPLTRDKFVGIGLVLVGIIFLGLGNQ